MRGLALVIALLLCATTGSAQDRPPPEPDPRGRSTAAPIDPPLAGPFAGPILTALWLGDDVVCGVGQDLLAVRTGTCIARPLMRFADVVTSAVALGGTRLAVGLQDGAVHLLDLADLGHARQSVFRGAGAVTLSSDPSTGLLVAAAEERSLSLIDAETGAVRRTIDGIPSIVSSLSCAGGRILIGGEDGSLVALDAAAGTVAAVSAGHRGAVTAVAIQAGGYVSGGADSSVRGSLDGAPPTTFGGHLGWVSAIVCVDESAAGDFVTAGYDGFIRGWRWVVRPGGTAGELAGVWRVHQSPIRCVAFDRRRGILATGGSDGTLRFLDGRQFFARAALPGAGAHDGDVYSVRWNAAGTLLVSASGDQTARVWDAETGRECARLRGHGATVNAAAFDPAGARIVTGSADQTVALWDQASGRRIATLPGHRGPVSSVAFDPRGARIASGSADHTVRLWNAASAALEHVLDGHANDVKAVAFSPDSTLLASAAADDTVRLWNAARGELVRIITRDGGEDHVHAVAFSPDGRRLAGGSLRGLIDVWSLPDGARLLRLAGHEGSVEGLSISPDGRTLASASADGSVRTWSLLDGSPQWVTRVHALTVYAAAYDPGGTRIATCSSDRTIRILDAGSGDVRRTISAHRAAVTALAIGRGARGWSAVGCADGLVRWGTAGGSPPSHEVAAHAGAVTGIVEPDDGRSIVSTGADGQVVVALAATGEVTRRIAMGAGIIGCAPTGVAGEIILATTAGAVTIVDVSRPGSGRPVWTLTQPASAFAVDPVHRRCAVAERDGGVVIATWDGATATARAIEWAGATVTALGFSEDGAALVAGDDDGVLSVAMVAGGPFRPSGRPHAGAVAAVAALGPGWVSVGADGLIRHWSGGVDRFAALTAGAGSTLGVAGVDRCISGHDDGSTELWRLPDLVPLGIGDGPDLRVESERALPGPSSRPGTGSAESKPTGWSGGR